MSEPILEHPLSKRIEQSRIGCALLRASQLLAVIGGGIFLCLIVLTVLSIMGRKLFASPVPGDIEIMQMAAATACACFFAYCHISFNDLKVELLTARLGPRTNAVLDTLASLGVAGFGYVLAWRTYVAAVGTLETGESSAILAWPVAWFQFGMVPGFALLALVGFYTAFLHLSIVFGASVPTRQKEK